jgi:hypothetical protein
VPFFLLLGLGGSARLDVGGYRRRGEREKEREEVEKIVCPYEPTQTRRKREKRERRKVNRWWPRRKTEKEERKGIRPERCRSSSQEVRIVSPGRE